ncbi:MAG: NAD(P)H-binding protein, partial [Salibacteraceae bacterium]
MIGNKKHYLIAGSTGLIGAQLLDLLLHDDETGKVTALVRSKSQQEHPKLQEKVIDWDMLTEKDLPPTIDAAFCCLGTTMAKAGNKNAFKKVDFDYVVSLAVFSQRKNIPQFHVVSATGSNVDSKVFYNRVKGNMEQEISKLDKFKSIYIYRPSLLLGNREEFRMAESIGKALMKTFSFLIPKSYKAIYDIQV